MILMEKVFDFCLFSRAFFESYFLISFYLLIGFYEYISSTEIGLKVCFEFVTSLITKLQKQGHGSSYTCPNSTAPVLYILCLFCCRRRRKLIKFFVRVAMSKDSLFCIFFICFAAGEEENKSNHS